MRYLPKRVWPSELVKWNAVRPKYASRAKLDGAGLGVCANASAAGWEPRNFSIGFGLAGSAGLVRSLAASAAGWLCYVERPSQCFEDDGRSVAPRPDRVFLVFVNDESVAYNWYWYAFDAAQPTFPEGHAERFKEQLL